MVNPYRYSDDNKRYRAYGAYLKKRFGQKVYRASLDIGAGCPNRDGTKGNGGCIFCPAGQEPLGKFSGISESELVRRFKLAKESAGEKSRGCPFIVYFQSGTNTYGDLQAFERVYEQALAFENTVGICIATRADCIDESVADSLQRLGEKTYLTVELGLQTACDRVAAICNRGHDLEKFLSGYRLLSERGINIGIHIINGLPQETHENHMETARLVAKLHPHCVKIHMLYIERGTAIAQMYEQKKFEMISEEEYIGTVCDQLEIFPEDVIIARLTGDGNRRKLIVPEWSLKKMPVLNEIDKELARRGTYQGCKYNK